MEKEAFLPFATFILILNSQNTHVDLQLNNKPLDVCYTNNPPNLYVLHIERTWLGKIWHDLGTYVHF